MPVWLDFERASWIDWREAVADRAAASMVRSFVKVARFNTQECMLVFSRATVLGRI